MDSRGRRAKDTTKRDYRSMLFDEDVIVESSEKLAPAEPAKIGIKKEGRVVLNRASTDEFQNRGFSRAVLLRRDNVLFIKSAKPKDLRSHKITFGKGGIPGLITAKSGLRSLGIDISQNRKDIPVTEVFEVGSTDLRSKKIQADPGDIVLAIELPEDAFAAAE